MSYLYFNIPQGDLSDLVLHISVKVFKNLSTCILFITRVSHHKGTLYMVCKNRYNKVTPPFSIKYRKQNQGNESKLKMDQTIK
jgi:hypothetical protein